MSENSKKMNLLDSTMIIIGSMIGSGIFIVSADIARQVEYPGMLIMAWVVTAIITILGALSYGELAAAMPKAGGQYVYLKEAYNPLVGFLYGWTLFSVIQTGTIAAVAVAFAKFLGVLFPEISGDNYLIYNFLSTQQVVAIIVIIGLSLYNFREIKKGAILQNIFTVTKIVALIGMVLLGFWFGFSGMGDFSHFTPAFPDIITLTTLGVFGAAMTGSLFSADAWNNITYTAGEIENPQRNLPLSLILGTGTVLIIYIFANISYLYILPIDSIKTADNDRVATLMMSTILGDKGKIIMALMIMVSTFGCLNGIILTAARAYYAMAKDGFFFKKAAVLNKNGVPANALVMQCVWACLLTLSGSYGQLLDYIMFAVLIFYCLTVAGVIILRRNQPNMERPYKVWAYPYLPIIYIVLAALVCVNIIWFKTEYSIRGLLVILIGIPIFYYFKKSNSYKNI